MVFCAFLSGVFGLLLRVEGLGRKTTSVSGDQKHPNVNLRRGLFGALLCFGEVCSIQAWQGLQERIRHCKKSGRMMSSKHLGAPLKNCTNSTLLKPEELSPCVMSLAVLTSERRWVVDFFERLEALPFRSPPPTAKKNASSSQPMGGEMELQILHTPFGV